MSSFSNPPEGFEQVDAERAAPETALEEMNLVRSIKLEPREILMAQAATAIAAVLRAKRTGASRENSAVAHMIHVMTGFAAAVRDHPEGEELWRQITGYAWDKSKDVPKVDSGI